jgi:transposase
MWLLPPGLKVYLTVEAVDMRKSVNGLSLYVQEILDRDPLSGHLFVFSNGSRRVIKVLYWDGSGFCLWYKRLERMRFHWPKGGEVRGMELDPSDLQWLLSGLEWPRRGGYRRLEYTAVG